MVVVKDAKIRVGVLDNDELALASMRRLSSHWSRCRLIWTTRSAAETIRACMVEATRPDVLLLDMSLSGVTGTDVCKQVGIWTDRVRCIGMTAYDPERYRDEAGDVGLTIIVRKERYTDIEDAILFSTIINVHPGKDGRQQNLYEETEAESKALSERELQIIDYYSKGMSTQEIMERTGFSKGTVRSYEKRALNKLGVRNRTEAAAYCVRKNLI
ncbi:LuxR C-terminal-related transcriptional regulator [Bifidobacterium samirii]|uniref:Two-component response regulator n=1 Tax=Bifidobacterium samirii TaxID=2306974 RepID=A0A430FUZ2_9BIFI|nr:response regulator transcription factor [Bifidobacterium samirii]RSX57284.1 two-component response regulator [Bifidobacterium samirii]